MNRRDLQRNLPFSNVGNAQLRAAAPQQLQNRGGAQITHRLLETHHHLAVTTEMYQTSHLFRFRANADMISAIYEMAAQMVPLLLQSRAARMRVTYRGLNNSIPLSRTTKKSKALEHTDMLGWLFVEIEDAIMALFTSNDEIELEDLYIVLDLAPAYIGGGGCSTYKEIEVQAIDFDCDSKDKKEERMKYICEVPRNMNSLCGWISLCLHISLNFKPECPEIPAEFWAQMSCSKRAMRNSDSYFQWLLTHDADMLVCATWLKNYCEGNNVFDYTADSDKFLAKFPQFKIVIIDAWMVVREYYKGLQWTNSMDAVNMRESSKCAKYTVYMHFNLVEKHYDLITDMFKCVNALRYKNTKMDKKIFCHGCHQIMYKKAFIKHTCTEISCTKCKTYFKDPKELAIHQKSSIVPKFLEAEMDIDVGAETRCPTCGIECYNAVCLTHHIRKCNSYSKRTECPKCLKWFFDISLHDCAAATFKCKNCDQECEWGSYHRCYVQKEPLPEEWSVESELLKYYAFDFESMFITETFMGVERHKHVVNYICVQQCGSEFRWSFETLNDFIQWTLVRSVDEEIYLVAHNLKGYDGRLLYDHIIKEIGIVPGNITWNGTKIMSLSLNKNLFFRDSLLHVQASLEQFPKIFGLDESQFAKGFFPYKFNTMENQHYIGPIPAQSYFEPEMMSCDKREKFMEWYKKQTGKVYDFRKELVKYCVSDVAILAKSLEIYITEGMQMNSGLNPMSKMTIASYALQVYRCLHMPENTIACLNKEEELFAKRSLHGGRTDVRCMMKFYSLDNVKDGVYAKYQDVQSLYPTVQFYKPLPCGIPNIHKFGTVQPTVEEMKDWFGLVECDIEPSKYLHHPVLLDRGEKLLATLKPLKNTVITTPELHEALKQGYIVTRVYEYHEYQKTTDLFKSYIRTFLKLKIQNSGMPAHIRSDEDWFEYQRYHREELGVELDREAMVKNPGKKQLAKMMLNSLWGKFAENKVYRKHLNLNDSTAYHLFEEEWSCGNIKIHIHQQVSPGAYMVSYSKPNETFNRTRAQRTNLTLASFVTAWGALTLWEEMHKLGRRVLYHDTDSIVYEYRSNEYNIPEGKYLGEWEDECGGLPITKFISIGPKTYSYAVLGKPQESNDQVLEKLLAKHQDFIEEDGQVYTLDYKTKCKGFSLNSYNSQLINFHSMQQLLLGTKEYLTSKALKFRWTPVQNSMYSTYETKVMRFCYDKGIIDNTDWTVYPYGYERFQHDGNGDCETVQRRRIY